MFTKLQIIAAAAALLIGLAGAARADYTGCYVGAHAGFAATSLEADGVLSLAGDGVQGGLGAGCDWQAAGAPVVIGVMADYTWQDLETVIGEAKATLKGQWAIAGRAGVTFGRTLVYGLVGYTGAEGSGTLIDVPDVAGWMAGAGVETPVGPQLSLKLEYRYVAFDDETIEDSTVEPDQHAVRLGLNWRFGGWLPQMDAPQPALAAAPVVSQHVPLK